MTYDHETHLRVCRQSGPMFSLCGSLAGLDWGQGQGA